MNSWRETYARTCMCVSAVRGACGLKGTRSRICADGGGRDRGRGGGARGGP